jgi:hypothetical protein
MLTGRAILTAAGHRKGFPFRCRWRVPIVVLDAREVTVPAIDAVPAMTPAALHALAARVDHLRSELNTFERYADACRSAAGKLSAAAGGLSRGTVDVGGMRSRAPRVDRARATAEAARGTVDSVRSRVDGTAGDLRHIAVRYDRKADSVRTDLAAATAQLSAARVAGG